MNPGMAFHDARARYCPPLPTQLEDLSALAVHRGDILMNPLDQTALRALFPHTFGQPGVSFQAGKNPIKKRLRIGVVLSGGQAAGGHNVITGLFDALKTLHSDSLLIGFLNGPSGIIDNKTIELTADLLENYRNQGGFDMIGSGRTKIETPEQFAKAAESCRKLDLDGLLVIGGDDSNTNAAFLAEYFLTHGCKTRVIGAPKTIDGDLKNEFVEISFGCDTACKTYSAIIGNLARDSLSAKKYYYFIKLMGRSASHIALECALQTQINLTLISEEVAAKKMTLKQITQQICDMIIKRAETGKNYGVILIPEGLIEFIPEVKSLINELNKIPAKTSDEILGKLTKPSAECFNSLPEGIQKQLLLDRDPHGNIQVSKIETERLLIETVRKELDQKKCVFNPQPLFCGYEGRSCHPSNFDAKYCYALGYVAALLLNNGLTGYMACVRHLSSPTEEWEAAGIPLTAMMAIEERKGEKKPVIKKALVDLQGPAFAKFQNIRHKWTLEDHYTYPGPIQFNGDPTITDSTLITLQMETESERIKV